VRRWWPGLDGTRPSNPSVERAGGLTGDDLTGFGWDAAAVFGPLAPAAATSRAGLPACAGTVLGADCARCAGTVEERFSARAGWPSAADRTLPIDPVAAPRSESRRRTRGTTRRPTFLSA